MVRIYHDSLELVPSKYETWGERFGAERERIRAVLAHSGLESAVESIEHVGSTAVPHLAAKDIVDLDIVVADDAVADVSQLLQAELGGDRVENSDEWHPIFRTQDDQRFNDHVFAASSDKWNVSVVTRGALRSRPDLRAAYEQLKRDLTEEHDDIVAYSEGKSAFIQRILAVASADDELAFDFAIPVEP